MIADFHLPDGHFSDFLQEVIDSAQPAVPTLMLSSSQEAKPVLLSFKSGVVDYLSKPFNMNVFLVKVDLILTALQATLYQIDESKRLLLCSGKTAVFTVKEMAIISAIHRA
jgi:DNA-binding response OmpR family regulator